MNRPVVLGAIAAVAVFAGVIYWSREPAQRSAQTQVPAKAEKPPALPAPPTVPAGPGLVSSSTPPPRLAPADPRVAVLMASPNNALVEYFSDAEGRVIKELDNDPNGPGYRKPLREYSYAGKQVISVVSYHYLGSQVQVVTTDVTYKPDGSVDQFHESTRYDYGKTP